MKGLLALVALGAAISSFSFQDKAAVGSNLTVISFGVEKMASGQSTPLDTNSSMSDPTTTLARSRMPSDATSASMQREADISRRSGDLRRVEENARMTSDDGRDEYQYRMKARNVDQRVIERVIWQFETADPSDRGNPTLRQFICGNRIKPNDAKEFRVVTPFAPSNVVSAADAGKSSDEKSNQSAVINRIEYADGTFWQNPKWDRARVESRLTDETYKQAKGRCVVL
jgi:hypothetical protein